MTSRPSIAILVPCLNEESTIAKVVADFATALPQAQVFVYDNQSTDQTARKAVAAGASVVSSPVPGKGAVVRQMLREVKADIYILVDGDATYCAADAPKLVSAITDGETIALGVREEQERAAYTTFRRWGNKALSVLFSALARRKISDPLTGYRAWNHSFHERFSPRSDGFEVETEMNLFAISNGLRMAEIATPYGARPLGSSSKLSVLRDGVRILVALARYVLSKRIGIPLQWVAASWILASSTARLVSRAALPGWAVAITAAAALAIILGAVLEARSSRQWKRRAATFQAATFGDQSKKRRTKGNST